MTTTADPTTRRYVTLNPATGELVKEFATATDAEAAAYLDRAHAAYQSWSKSPIQRRVELFHRMAELIEKHASELARLITLEMGKPVGQSRLDALAAVEMFRYIAEVGPDLLADRVIENVPGHRKTIMSRASMGVVVGIEPWNGPIYQAMRAATPNLFIGNTVLLKPAEISPGSTLYMDELFKEAGFPDAVYQTTLVSTAQISTYLADPRVRAVTLTGSDRAGSAVGEQAGKHIKPAVLELGGSDAFIVLDSADVQAAAGTAAMCRLLFGGQVCTSPKRLIVTQKVADEFTSAFVSAFGSAVIGDGMDPHTTLGPMSSQAALNLIQDQYDDAVARGATVLLPGGKVDGPGFFFRPAVLTDMTTDMRLYSEEAFGPVGVIYRVQDAAEAVALANSSPYGLGGVVFGEESEAEAVAREMDTGMVGINTFFTPSAEVPFGGTKRSGLGRELGPVAFDAFSNLKVYGFA